MKKLIILFSLVLLIGPGNAFTQSVSPGDANTVAENWIRNRAFENTHTIKNKDLLQGADNNPLAHIFELYPAGYVIISAVRDLPPVIAYSFDGSYRQEGGAIKPLEEILIYDLDMRIDHIDQLSSYVIAQNHTKWDELLSGIHGKSSFEQWPPAGSTSTGGWLETSWKQSAPYNKFCPLDLVTGSRSVAGCPAVALAMIIHYQKGLNGTQFDDNDDYYHSYAGRQYWIDDDSHPLEFLSFPEINEYLDSMAAKFPVYAPLTEDEMAALVFACGVAAEQVYTSEVSGTFGVDQAYDAYMRFGFNDAMMIFDSDTSFFTHMKNNMKDGIPVHLALLVNGAGGGHNVVTDGYNTDDYYHLNFGWGGSYNGWYLIPDEIPYNLTIVEGAIMDIGVSHVGMKQGEPEEIDFSIYPNPSNGIVNISLELKEPAKLKVLIYDQKGSTIQIIAEDILQEGMHQFSHNWDLYPGIYYVQIMTNDKVHTEKLIIQH